MGQPVSARLRVFALAAVATASAADIAASQIPIEALYRSLHDARPDGRSIAVVDLVLVRDVFTLHLRSGRLHLLSPAGGHTHGAVFLGQGELRLAPSSEGERRHLALRSGTPDLQQLQDSFEQAVLWFGATTEAELLAAGPVELGEPDTRAAAALEAALNRQGEEALGNLPLRILRDRLNEDGLEGEAFFAFVDGGALGRFRLGVEPMGMLDAEESFLYVSDAEHGGFWYSSHVRRELESGAASSCRRKPLVDALHYEVESVVARTTDLEGTAAIRFKVLVPGLRVLPFELLPSLGVREATLEGAGAAAAPVSLVVVQEDGEAAVLFPDSLADSLKMGTEATLRLAYSGDGVLLDDGASTYRVQARSSWYPNLGPFRDAATYDLVFRVPRGNTVIAVGEPVESADRGSQTVSRWKTEQPITVAGFNYGSFKRYEHVEPNTGARIEVYASTGTPDVLAEVNDYLAAVSAPMTPSESVEAAGDDSFVNLPAYAGPTEAGVSTETLAQTALADAVNAVQVYTAYFGQLPTRRLAITQQSDWTFGQAWPSLVYLPYLAALGRMARVDLGLQGYDGFLDEVGLHEIAHQWWGHQVGWASYRDQWLSEGFAEFSTALVLELVRGPQAYDDFWAHRRGVLLGSAHGTGVANVDAGPITLGFRASTERSPGAYAALAYSKGGFVLHMLRLLMREHQSEKPDRRFFAMLKDFVTTFAGWSASTEDFKEIVQEHMIPELNANGDGTVDWFFDQWVYGTGVPTFTTDFRIEKADKGQYRLVGSVTQSGVPDGFLTLVPVYADLGKGMIGMFGRAPFKGNMTREFDVTLELPRKPRAVVVNAHHDVLGRGAAP